jgi:hypothetical protein
MTRRLHWLGVAALVVLAGRALAYGLAPRPTPLTLQLERQVGGPTLVVTAIVALGLALLVGAALVWIATLMVRERHLLSGAPGTAPTLRPARVARAAVLLWLTTSIAFGALEAYLHWRAGLGFHGLHCLLGPVHRDALPIFGAVSLVAAAVEAAACHLLRWMRRTLAALRPRRPALVRVSSAPLRPRSHLPLRPVQAGADGARGPPLPAPA